MCYQLEGAPEQTIVGAGGWARCLVLLIAIKGQIRQLLQSEETSVTGIRGKINCFTMNSV